MLGLLLQRDGGKIGEGFGHGPPIPWLEPIASHSVRHMVNQL